MNSNLPSSQDTKPNGKEKDGSETSLKRTRSSSLAAAVGPQRVPVGPGRSTTQVATITTSVTTTFTRAQRPTQVQSRVQRPVSQHPSEPGHLPQDNVVAVSRDHDMEADHAVQRQVTEVQDEQDVMTGVVDSDEEDAKATTKLINGREDDEYIWPEFSPGHAIRFAKEVDQIRSIFADAEDGEDSAMVSEYAEEIFEYMNELEVSRPPRV